MTKVSIVIYELKLIYILQLWIFPSELWVYISQLTVIMFERVIESFNWFIQNTESLQERNLVTLYDKVTLININYCIN